MAGDPIPANLEAAAGDINLKTVVGDDRERRGKKNGAKCTNTDKSIGHRVSCTRTPIFSRAATTFGVRIRNYWSKFSFFMPKDKVGSGFTKLSMMLLLKNSTIGSTK